MFKKVPWVLILLMFISCGPRVMLPPEIDLTPYERVGLISFSIENAEGHLDKIATQRFLQEITWFQKGVQVIELGTLDEVLGKVKAKTLDQDAVKVIGEQFGVTSFFYGKIIVSDVKPQIDLAALVKSLRVRAQFDISITSRLFSTETGATLWTDSADREGTLAFMSMDQSRIPYFDLRDQDRTYKEFIERLIRDLTRDFRPRRGD